MKVYILTDAPYHDNEMIYGVFSSLYEAQKAHLTFYGSDYIVECELDSIRPFAQKLEDTHYTKMPRNRKPAEVDFL